MTKKFLSIIFLFVGFLLCLYSNVYATSLNTNIITSGYDGDNLTNWNHDVINGTYWTSATSFIAVISTSPYDSSGGGDEFFDFFPNLTTTTTGQIGYDAEITGLDTEIDSNSLIIEASAYMHTYTRDEQAALEVRFYNASGTIISEGHEVSYSADYAWTPKSISVNVPANTRKIRIILKAKVSPVPNGCVDFDGISAVLKTNPITLSGVSPTLLKAGTVINATSNLSGTLYLVPKADYGYRAALDAVSTKKTVTCSAGVETSIPTTGLSEGKYQVYAVNDTGIFSASSADITIDNTAPTTPTISGISDDTGSSATDGITYDTSLTVSGTAEASSTITVYNGTTVLGTTTVGSDGTWGAAIVSLTEGSYNFTATATDTAGNTSAASSEYAVTVDTTAPKNQNTVFSNSGTKEGGAVVTITSAGETGGSVWVAPSGTTSFIAGTTMTVAGGRDTIILAPATAGTYYLYVIDAAGNISAASTSTLTVDNTAPTLTTVTIVSNNSNTSQAKTGDQITLGITASENINTPIVTIAGNTATVNNAGDTDDKTWQATYTMAGTETEGTIAFSISFSDLTGNAGTAVSITTNNSSVTYDKTAPTISSVSVPSSKTYIAGDNLDFTVNYSEAVAVTKTSGTPYIPITLDTGGTVQATYVSGSGTTALVFRYTVVSGNYDNDGVSAGATITANGGTIKNAAGNNATLTLNFGSTTGVLVDAVAPTLSNVSPTILKADTVISATSSEEGYLYLVSEGTYTSKSALSTAAQATATVTAVSLTGSLDTTGLSEGAYQIYAVDSAGNLSLAVNVTISNNTPVVVFTRPSNGAKLNINTGSMVIAKLYNVGTGIDPDSVTIQIDGGTAVKPTKLVETSEGYTLYYVITSINYGTTDYSHTITISVKDSTNTYTGTGSVTFTMEPKRKGFGFGRLRFD